jgi:hypothetical protein
MAVVMPGISLELVGDAERLALLVMLGLDLLEILAGAGLDLRGGVFVEAFDGGQFAGSTKATSSTRGEAFRSEQLADDFVDIERFHEQRGTLDEFLLATLGFFLLGQDVDIPAGQLRGEAHILAATTDGKR